MVTYLFQMVIALAHVTVPRSRLGAGTALGLAARPHDQSPVGFTPATTPASATTSVWFTCVNPA